MMVLAVAHSGLIQMAAVIVFLKLTRNGAVRGVTLEDRHRRKPFFTAGGPREPVATNISGFITSAYSAYSVGVS